MFSYYYCCQINFLFLAYVLPIDLEGVVTSVGVASDGMSVMSATSSVS